MNNAKTRGAQAIRARQEAERFRNLKPARGQVDVLLNQIEAEREEARVAEFAETLQGIDHRLRRGDWLQRIILRWITSPARETPTRLIECATPTPLRIWFSGDLHWVAL
jgi:hypothetical protein